MFGVLDFIWLRPWINWLRQVARYNRWSLGGEWQQGHKHVRVSEMLMSASVRQQKCAIFMHTFDLCTKRAWWGIQNDKNSWNIARATEIKWIEVVFTKPCSLTLLEIPLHTLERHKCYDGSGRWKHKVYVKWSEDWTELVHETNINAILDGNQHHCISKAPCTFFFYSGIWHLTEEEEEEVCRQLLVLINKQTSLPTAGVDWGAHKCNFPAPNSANSVNICDKF